MALRLAERAKRAISPSSSPGPRTAIVTGSAEPPSTSIATNPLLTRKSEPPVSPSANTMSPGAKVRSALASTSPRDAAADNDVKGDSITAPVCSPAPGGVRTPGNSPSITHSPVTRWGYQNSTRRSRYITGEFALHSLSFLSVLVIEQGSE